MNSQRSPTAISRTGFEPPTRWWSSLRASRPSSCQTFFPDNRAVFLTIPIGDFVAVMCHNNRELLDFDKFPINPEGTKKNLHNALDTGSTVEGGLNTLLSLYSKQPGTAFGPSERANMIHRLTIEHASEIEDPLSSLLHPDLLTSLGRALDR